MQGDEELREFLIATARRAAASTQSSVLETFTRAKSQAFLFGRACEAFPDLEKAKVKAAIQLLRRELAEDPEASKALERPTRPPISGREPITAPEWDERLRALSVLIDVPMTTVELLAKAERELGWSKSFFQAAIATSEGRGILEYQPPHWMPAPKERTVQKSNRVRVRKTSRMIECLIDPSSEAIIVQRQKEVNSKRGLLGARISDKEKEIRARHRRELAEALGPLRTEKSQLDKELQELVDRLSEGKTLREVECEERLDFEAGVVAVVRLDTRDIVDRRPMAFDERQLELGDL